MAVHFFHLPKTRTGRLAILALLSFVALLPKQAVAQGAISFDTTPDYSLSTGQGVYGWQFTPGVNIQVSALGVFDNASVFDSGFPGDGMIEAHAIGIWDVTSPSSPLVSTTIPAGTDASLVNGFRYVNVNPVTLPAGHDFVIAALYASTVLSNQDWLVGAPNNPGFVLTTGPGIQFDGYRYNNLTTLSFPNFYTPNYVFGFGPNFTYSAVPEPSISAICGLVVAVAFGRPKAKRNTE